MGAKARVTEITEPEPTPADGAAAFGQMVFLALPSKLYVDLTNEAAKRNMTLSVFLSKALSEYLGKPLPGAVTEEGK